MLAIIAAGVAQAETPALKLETKVSLGRVQGRIDHLAIDVNRRRLYVAELGNDTVAVVDLQEGRLLRRLTGLREPQGIGYVPSTDTLYVANAGDGSVRLFLGPDLIPSGQIALGRDADNVRVDDTAHRVYVGYADGDIAVIDTANRQKIADIPLKAHPESFQLDSTGSRIFANVPDAHEVALVDRATNRQIAQWSTDALRANYPMALDTAHARVLAAFRQPAKMGAFDAGSGRLVTTVDTCGDADDVFFDAKRSRVYVICGDGLIDVFDARGDGYTNRGRIPTARGARTAFFSRDLDQLMLAVQASSEGQASIWVFRPAI